MLFQSVFDSLPIYRWSIFRILRSVMRRSDAIRCYFYWHGSGNTKRGGYEISWGRICRSKENRKLNLKNINDFNQDLLAKWVWKLGTSDKGRWVNIIRQKYYYRGTPWELNTTPHPGSFTSHIWRGGVSVNGCDQSWGSFCFGRLSLLQGLD